MDLSKPPEGMSPAESATWDKVFPTLPESLQTDPGTLILLKGFCQVTAVIDRLTAEVRGKEVIKTPHTTKQNPIIPLLSKYRKEQLEYARMLGLGFKEKTKAKANAPKPQSKLGAFLANG